MPFNCCKLKCAISIWGWTLFTSYINVFLRVSWWNWKAWLTKVHLIMELNNYWFRQKPLCFLQFPTNCNQVLYLLYHIPSMFSTHLHVRSPFESFISPYSWFQKCIKGTLKESAHPTCTNTRYKLDLVSPKGINPIYLISIYTYTHTLDCFILFLDFILAHMFGIWFIIFWALVS